MPCHRSGFARGMKAHRELAALEDCGCAREREYDRIAPHRSTCLDRDAGFAAEGHWPARPLDDGRTSKLQANEASIKRDRSCAKHIGEAEPGLPAPDVGPHDQAKCLIASALFWGGKRSPLVRLGRWISDGIGALRGASPTHHPLLSILSDRDRRAHDQQGKRDRSCPGAHYSSRSGLL